MKSSSKMFKFTFGLFRWAVLPIALLAIAAASAEAAHFDGMQTGPNEWTYTLTYEPLDNYAVCPSPGDIATITLSGLQGVVSATAPTSTDFEPTGGLLDTVNLAWVPEVSSGGTVVTLTHFGPGTGNFGVDKHVFGFKVFTATPAVNGTVNVASDGFSIDVSCIGPCPVQPADDRDFTQTTNGPVGPATLQLAIDIKPGSFPNSINPHSRGKIPVAILTTDTFDATTVDPSTVLFGVNGIEAAAVQSALEDVDGDGDVDMILHFSTQNTGIVCGDTYASLTGETFDGQMIEGSDSVNTVGCK